MHTDVVQLIGGRFLIKTGDAHLLCIRMYRMGMFAASFTEGAAGVYAVLCTTVTGRASGEPLLARNSNSSQDEA
ncbi:hypothetical protein [Bacillus swezeyi]|uniref:hypothetical protein n=1 Tax=Bacillus swezeyi TaxID=1925020 RepID=UPI001CC22F1A|nr:hypothetical protein [Bacillus swezeyi]